MSPLRTIPDRLALLAASARLFILLSGRSMAQGPLRPILMLSPAIALFGLILISAPLFVQEAAIHSASISISSLSLSSPGPLLLALALLWALLLSAAGLLILHRETTGDLLSIRPEPPRYIGLSFAAAAIVAQLGAHPSRFSFLASYPLLPLLFTAGGFLLVLAALLWILWASRLLLLKGPSPDWAPEIQDAELRLLRARLAKASRPASKAPRRSL